MSGRGPESFEDIVDGIYDAIASVEGRLGATVIELNSMLAMIGNARSAIQGTIEEHKLERLMASPTGTVPDDDDEDKELKDRDNELLATYARVSAVYRQLNGFVHLLTTSRQQFRSDEELPGIDDAQRLALRQSSIQAQEDERRRLAREIHDGPAQVLANAIIGLEFVGRSLSNPGDGRRSSIEEIDRVKLAMREGLTEIRRFMFDLRPTMLGQRGLAATTEHYIQTYQHLFPGEIELSVADDLPQLTPDQEMTAFRVIRESLQNVHRHSRATRTWVSILASDVGLEIAIRDNGIGFRPSAAVSDATSGFGLVGMRERAEVIGADLTVVSEPGSGTAVRLTIPVSTQAAVRSLSNARAVRKPARGGRSESD